jgi:hypothetical protein
MNYLFLISFLSLLFWGIYQKWDEKKQEYIEHPIRTSIYFIFSSMSLILIYPPIAKLFEPSVLSVLFFSTVIYITFILYKILKKIFKGPQNPIQIEHKYWKLLNQKYIWPKIFEITFQQTYLGAIFIVLFDLYGFNLETAVLTFVAFIVAHIPLIFIQGKKIGLVYLKWSIVGAPVFVLLILGTQNLWYSISIHMLFYTTLSLFTWMFSGTKFEEN